MKTYANKAAARKGAARQGVKLDALTTFVKNDEGRWYWVTEQPAPEPVVVQGDAAQPAFRGKRGIVYQLVTRPEGVTGDELASRTGWDKNTAASDIYQLATKLGRKVVSEGPRGAKVYRLA
jgi:hypothetical protein